MTSDQVLRTGVLFKKGSGTGPFGRKNWKPRYFVLTPTKLTYYTYEDGDLKGEVDLKGCTEQSIEVMPADSMKTGSSASTIWRIAVNAADRRLLVAAGTEMEMNDWVEQLLMAFRINSGQPLPSTRQSMDHVSAHMPAGGAIMNTNMGSDLSRHSITDFQNFASARRSVGSAVRASLGAMPSHEFRLSDELERNKAEQDRLAAQRETEMLEAERRNQEELLLAQQRSQAEERQRQQQYEEEQRRLKQEELQRAKEEEEQRLLEEQARVEALLEEQRRQKREKHERERLEAERKLQELELEEQEKRHEVEVRRHFDEEVVEVEIRRRPMPQQEPVPSSPVASTRAQAAPSTPPRSSLIGDAKKEAMARQTAEHNKRREAAIKEQQEQMRQDFLAQQKLQDDALRASHVQQKTASPPRSPVQSELLYQPAMSPVKRTSVAKLEPTTSVEF